MWLLDLFRSRPPTTFAYREHAANVKDDLGRTLAGIQHTLISEKSIAILEEKPARGSGGRY